MKFVKGVALGAIITASAMMICSETVDDGKKRMIKKGRQFAKKMGIS